MLKPYNKTRNSSLKEYQLDQNNKFHFIKLKNNDYQLKDFQHFKKEEEFQLKFKQLDLKENSEKMNKAKLAK